MVGEVVLVGTGGEEVVPLGVLEEVEGAVRVLDAAHKVRVVGIFPILGYFSEFSACCIVGIGYIATVHGHPLGEVQVVVGDAGDAFVFVHGHVAIRIVKVVIATNWCKWRGLN
ncbi:MAG: hypothetical protein OEY56_07725 [Cyclobacteriaceae bacterium]|nr:hypothetical protein [Cyclobacteriaceae bacterium]